MSSQVFAQSKNFEGFAVEFSTGSQKNSLSNGPILLNADNTSTGASVASGSKDTTPAIIGLSYGFKLADKIVTTVGLDYNLMSSSIAAPCVGCNVDTVTEKVSGRYNLYIAPGYQFSSSSLAYVKLSYGQNSKSISARAC